MRVMEPQWDAPCYMRARQVRGMHLHAGRQLVFSFVGELANCHMRMLETPVTGPQPKHADHFWNHAVDAPCLLRVRMPHLACNA